MKSVPKRTIIKVDENMASEPCNDLRSFQGLKCSLERSPTIAAIGSAIARVTIEIKKVIGFSQKKTDKIINKILMDLVNIVYKTNQYKSLVQVSSVYTLLQVEHFYSDNK